MTGPEVVHVSNPGTLEVLRVVAEVCSDNHPDVAIELLTDSPGELRQAVIKVAEMMMFMSGRADERARHRREQARSRG